MITDERLAMTAPDELRRLAEAARDASDAYDLAPADTPEEQDAALAVTRARRDMENAISPATILALLDERDRLRAACAAFVEWLDSDDRGPSYPEGTTRDWPGNEAIWQQWWDAQSVLCARAVDSARAALESPPT